MTDAVLAFIRGQGLLPGRGGVVLCGVSGGADSMALLIALRALSEELGIEPVAAHYNHRLRGAESARDEDFVREYCRKAGVRAVFSGGDVRGEAARRGMSVEACAREMRYAFFDEAMITAGASFTATAHNADDNAETVIFNLARGASLRGLCGIPPKRGNIIRPLLCVTRADIERFLTENGVSWVEDSSNTDTRHTRNLIRSGIMPVLRQINPKASERIFETTRILRQDEDRLSREAMDLLGDVSGGEPAVEIAKLQSMDPALRGRAVAGLYALAGGDRRALTGRHVEGALGLRETASPSARLSLPGGIEAFRRYGELCFARPSGECRGFSGVKIIPGEGVMLPGYEARCEVLVVNEKFIQDKHTFYINYANIVGDVLIRSREKGDIIKISGMTKSLKKLMIEKKIPARLRDGVPVVCDGAGVLAVYGVGISDRARPAEGDRALAVTLTGTGTDGVQPRR